MDNKEMRAGLMDFVMASYSLMSRVQTAMKMTDGENKALRIIFDGIAAKGLENCDLNCLCIDDYDEENFVYDMEIVRKMISSMGDDADYDLSQLKTAGALMHDVMWSIGINSGEWWIEDGR